MKRIATYGLTAVGLLVAGAAIAVASDDDHGRHHRGHWDHAKMAEHFFQDFDLNKDGKVTKAEVDQVNAQRFREAAGGGSSVSLDQFIKLHADDARERDEKRFQHMDKNSDGKLTENEFEGRRGRMFDHMDKNKDGVITQDEANAPRDHDGPPPEDKPE